MERNAYHFLTFLLVFTPFFAIAADDREPLTFQDRVEAQAAIEKVYYNHRIWPKENPGPKPPFDQLVPRAIIEAKVTDYLKKGAALDKFWHRPIEPSQLQAEMDRMARETRDPATLKELFAALGNDPNMIAECLARPALTSRLLDHWYAYDSRFHGQARQQAERAKEQMEACGNHGPFPEGFERIYYDLEQESESSSAQSATPSPCHRNLNPGDFRKPSAESEASLGKPVLKETAGSFLVVMTIEIRDQQVEAILYTVPKRDIFTWWQDEQVSLPTSDEIIHSACPFRLAVVSSEYAPRTLASDGWMETPLNTPHLQYHTVVWTGAEMIVWGGGYISTTNEGGVYSPATDSWRPTSRGTNCPSNREGHTAVWTGTRMVVWGGYTGSNTVNTGALYDPQNDSWTPTSTGSGCPSKRYGHTAAWTGTEMIVWGGSGTEGYSNTGGRYSPDADSWVPTPTGIGCPVGRWRHEVVWTGEEMILWGGWADGVVYVNSGARYNPSSETWAPTSTGAGCPTKRIWHTAVWTGTEMIIWGGNDNDFHSTELNTGGRYNPTTDTWIPTSTGDGCPEARHIHTAVWTGTEMIIWGGGIGNKKTNTGGRYNPTTDSWGATSVGSGCPEGAEGHSAIWTGEEMIVWGGQQAELSPSYGGRYSPATDSWVPTWDEWDLLSRRDNHTAIWTGAEMVVWGGGQGVMSTQKTGGVYTPATRDWVKTSTGTGCPDARYDHTAVWTGTEVIVWGGLFSTSTHRNTGARYRPDLDQWTATDDGLTCPSARADHTAIWTGTEMIVWGGYSSTGNFNTGGRYDPFNNTWAATSTGSGCPEPRRRHTAVWTGTEMIIWGGVGSNTLATGGRYQPAADSWVATSTGSGCPVGREKHTAIWTGSEMIIWGGDKGALTLQNTGGRYRPIDDAWTATGTGAGCPVKRADHTAVWTGSEMIVWGGSMLNSGGRYTPGSDSWIVTSTSPPCPSGRARHTAVWTGTDMIAWGGAGSGPGEYFNTGGHYFPTLPECTLTCTASATPPSGHSPLAVAFAAQATASHCTGSQSFSWDFGDGGTSTAQNPAHTYQIEGTYAWTLTVSISDKTCSQSGSITVTAPPPKPGDCDGDGSVSIGEVQKAINMFLGAAAPDCGVDCDGNGQISIGEVQKVINAFLGAATSC